LPLIMSEASHVRSFGSHHYVNRIGRHEYMWLAHPRDAGSHLIRGSFADGLPREASRVPSPIPAALYGLARSKRARGRVFRSRSTSLAQDVKLDQLGAGRTARRWSPIRSFGSGWYRPNPHGRRSGECHWWWWWWWWWCSTVVQQPNRHPVTPCAQEGRAPRRSGDR
jgi:hypothetical protein